MSQPRDDLDRLARYVVNARIDAGFATRKDLAAATGVTARTLGKLETGSERVSADTLARVAARVGWTPDSPYLVMAGREPVPAGTGAPAGLAIDSGLLEDADQVIIEEARTLFPGDKMKQLLWIGPATREEKLALIRVLDEGRREIRERGNPAVEETA